MSRFLKPQPFRFAPQPPPHPTPNSNIFLPQFAFSKIWHPRNTSQALFHLHSIILVQQKYGKTDVRVKYVVVVFFQCMVGHPNFGAIQISMQRFHFLVSLLCGDFEYYFQES